MQFWKLGPFFMERTYFSVLKKWSLLTDFFFSEIKEIIQKWQKIIEYGSKLIGNQYTEGTYLICKRTNSSLKVDVSKSFNQTSTFLILF